jgi:hypothetical protein
LLYIICFEPAQFLKCTYKMNIYSTKIIIVDLKLYDDLVKNTMKTLISFYCLLTSPISMRDTYILGY